MWWQALGIGPNGERINEPTAGCPADWDKIEPHGCFYHQKEPLTWDEAKQRCRAMDPKAHLAEPDSKAFFQAIGKKYAAYQNPFVEKQDPKKKGPWIGATDQLLVNSTIRFLQSVPIGSCPNQLFA